MWRSSYAVVAFSLEKEAPRGRLVCSRAMGIDLDRGARWSLHQRVGFPVLFVYAMLYMLPQFPGLLLSHLHRIAREPAPETIGAKWQDGLGWFEEHALKPYGEWWDKKVVQFGETFLPDQKITARPAGSGDTTWNFVELALDASIALLIGLAWGALEFFLWGIGWKGRHLPWLGGLLLFAMRWFLLLYMFTYGFAKVIQTQFPPPRPSQLIVPYGDFSPMGLVWRFMGFSTAYNVFTGMGEVLGGLFMLWRRTVTLGALLVIAVMSNVVMINFCFDVPVKLFSAHLLAMGVALMLLDLRRVMNVLVLNRPAMPVSLPPRFGSVIVDRAMTAGKVLLVAAIIWGEVDDSLRMQHLYGSTAPKPAFYGTHDVEVFTRDGAEVPALYTDATRWRQVVIEGGPYVVVRYADDHRVYLGFQQDPEQKTFTISTDASDPAKKFVFHYEELEPGVLKVAGTLEGQELDMRWRARPLGTEPLLARGFHWANEFPRNR